MLEFIRWLSVSIQNGKRREGRDPPSAWQSVETQPQPWQGEHWARLDTADRWQPTTGWNPQSKRARRKTKPIITQTLKASSRLVKDNCILPWCAQACYNIVSLVTLVILFSTLENFKYHYLLFLGNTICAHFGQTNLGVENNSTIKDFCHCTIKLSHNISTVIIITLRKVWYDKCILLVFSFYWLPLILSA